MRLRKRKTRVHFKSAEASIEGILIRIVAGHYELAGARFVESPDKAYALPGNTLIPKDNVLFLQELS